MFLSANKFEQSKFEIMIDGMRGAVREGIDDAWINYLVGTW